MKTRAFQQVDVFSAHPYRGNALAVVMDGTGLDTEEMQQFARWTNLAETTFLLPPGPEAAAAGAHYRVRIFTNAYEMPFAGHPTLGSCHAWLEAGGLAQVTPDDDGNALIVQECKVGLVRIRRTAHAQGHRLAFAAPPLVRTDAAPGVQEALAQALGLDQSHILAAQHLCNGPKHFGFWVDSVDAVLALRPDYARLAQVLPEFGIGGVGLASLASPTGTPDTTLDMEGQTPPLIIRSNREARAFGPSGTGALAETVAGQPGIELRFFATGSNGVSEDPVTGSFNASMAQWLTSAGHVQAPYVAAQGRCVGSDGKVYIDRDDVGQIWVGGDSVTCIRGQVDI